MSGKKKVLVIGDGVMAWNTLFALQNCSYDVFQYYHNEAFPACSDASTAINCLRGTTKGISPLGDLIVDSYHCFEAFLKKHDPQGIAKGHEYQIFDQEQKWKGRYPDFEPVHQSEIAPYVSSMKYFHKNEAYFFDLKKLREWFSLKLNNTTKKQVIVSQVLGDGRVITSDGEEKFDYVIVCSNYNTSIVKGLNSEVDYYIDHCKPVAGSYLELKGYSSNYFSQSTNLAFEKYHLIFRKEEKILQIGATTDNRTSHHLPNEKALVEIYDFIKKQARIELPAFSEFSYRVGVRLKGYKRMPYCDFITPHVYLATGLYKNGYLLPFKIGQDIRDLLC